jgi:hypothetical protein
MREPSVQAGVFRGLPVFRRQARRSHRHFWKTFPAQKSRRRLYRGGGAWNPATACGRGVLASRN